MAASYQAMRERKARQMSDGKPTDSRRRDVLIFAGGLAAVYVGFQWTIARPPKLKYQPLADPPGFRRITGGAATHAAFDPFAGIDDGSPRVVPISDARLCAAFFPNADGQGVPVAYFSDYFCPNCRVLTGMLDERVVAGTIRLSLHEWPILSAASELAARAALAAQIQGGYEAFRARLTRAAFVPDETYLRDLSAGAGLNADQLLRDMTSENVTGQLALTRSLAARFRLFATPSMVIGRTLVIGRVSARQLDEIIAAEAAPSGNVCKG